MPPGARAARDFCAFFLPFSQFLFHFFISIPMGFFNFGNTTNNTTATSNERKPVILQLNEEQITVSPADAEGKSVAELFSQYADDLGDTDRINRFVAAGQIVGADTIVELGTVYRGAITSETKGIA